ncbi:MAG TPA: LLM class F420-dependent oxidoreductase [Mycobacteriales bacterium]|nr:LLM class F420-dependent oxidoreductase [Mycobacteriales bacterium]
MDLRVFTEPQQGATYDDLLRVARATEDLGFDAFFRSDHYQRIGRGDPGPGSTDAWVTLGALARETARIRLGTLLSPATFRLPGPLAISVAQVDQMSGGRVELGLGTGWFGAEHTAYGIPFGTTGERFDRLTEQLEIVTGLWATPSGGTFSHDGAHYTLVDSPALPKPVQQPRPPIIVGGHGARRTPALAARFADEFNIPFPDSVATAAEQFDRVRSACRDAGRDPAGIRLSAALVLCCGRDDAEVARRAGVIGQPVEQLRGGQAAGTVSELVERLGEYAAVGASRIYLQTLDLGDLDHLELVAADVRRQV